MAVETGGMLVGKKVELEIEVEAYRGRLRLIRCTDSGDRSAPPADRSFGVPRR